MLRNLKQLEGRTLHARDGAIGQVRDIYFDDRHWYVRYFVVETGAWLQERRVLLAPEALGPLDWNLQAFPVKLTTEQIRCSPGIETDQPVSRQHEESLRKHYGWPMYWEGVFGVGGLATPILAPLPADEAFEPGMNDGKAPLRRGDPTLRSANDTAGYHLEAVDGAVGHVDDFLVDENGWRIRYLVIDTRNWWPGKKVLVAPQWIKDVSWTSRSVSVDLSREAIKGSPPYDPSAPWQAAHADALHDYYGRPRYSDWDEDIVAGAPKQDRRR